MARMAATLFFSMVVLSLRADALLQRAGPVSLPEGPGRELVATRCVGCHDLDTAVSRRATANEWRDIVAEMIKRGAQVPGTEAAAIVTYLAQHYGATTPAAGQPAATLAEGPGRELLMNKCFQCHSQAMWNDLRQDRRAWTGVLYRMVGRRALWTEDEINGMADYLARVRGPDAK